MAKTIRIKPVDAWQTVSITFHAYVEGPAWMPAWLCARSDEYRLSRDGITPFRYHWTGTRQMVCDAVNIRDLQYAQMVEGYYEITRVRHYGNSAMQHIRRWYVKEEGKEGIPAIADLCKVDREVWEKEGW